MLYGAKETENLNALRYKRYLTTIGKQPVHANFKLAALPPTEDAAREHSLRVYHQVQLWHGVAKDPLQWGWKKIGRQLRPVTTSMAAAPDELLRLISCCCTDDCTRNCECRKNGLQCSRMCITCVGLDCTNRDEPEDFDAEQILVSDDVLLLGKDYDSEDSEEESNDDDEIE